MQEIYIDNIKQVMMNKDFLEKELNVNIENKGKNVLFEGKAENEFVAMEVFKAFNLNFSVERALLLKKENYILQTVNIKDLTKRKEIHEIKARIIGTQGKTLKTLNNLTDCNISLNENQVGIIGETESIDDAIIAVKSLIQGSKQSNVYARLEKEKKKRRLNLD